MTEAEAIKLAHAAGVKARPSVDGEIFGSRSLTLSDLPDYVPEDKNPNVLIKGRWLERGGSAFWVSTAGTGKSIAAVQLAMMMSEGIPFAGLTPRVKLRFWIVQSEDSWDRVAIDRDDVTAELTEVYPDVDWKDVWRRVRFVDVIGKVGTKFIDEMDGFLARAKERNRLPDVLIINPFLAFVGGPVTDGGYVTPFLRGGIVGREETEGLQALLMRYNIGALIFHHTPKPPTEKEIDAWMKSQFPEYQGAGSSDITNWGRSFVTMMRVKGHRNMVCLTAGKNGNELGWEELDGANRHYLAFSNGKSVTGSGRHAWRELTDEEMQDFRGAAAKSVDDSVKIISDALIAQPATRAELIERGRLGLGKRAFENGWQKLMISLSLYDLKIAKCQIGRTRTNVVGRAPQVYEYAAKLQSQQALKMTDSHGLPRTPAGARQGDKNNGLPPPPPLGGGKSGSPLPPVLDSDF